MTGSGPVSPWHGLLRGVPVLVGLAAAALAAAHFDMVLPWMIPACLLGLVLGAWSVGTVGTASLAAALLFAGFGMTIGLVPTAALTAAGVAGPLAASAIPANPDALGYYLRDSRIATEFAVSRAFRGTRSGGSPVTWHAAPLVDASWTRDQPVPAWIIAQETAGSDPTSPASRRRWDQPITSALRIGAPSSGRGPEVAALAAARHGLTSAAGAVYVTGSANPEEDQRLDGRLVLALLGIAIAANALIASRFWLRWRAGAKDAAR
jgi:hypothetical protein